MGDRANVFVKDNDENGVYLYTHSEGTRLPQVLQEALTRGQSRWGDSQYLTRIIFCQMIQNNWDSLTGFGISSIVGDGESRVLTVNCQKQTVSYGDSEWTFTEYTVLGQDELSEIWNRGE